MKGRTQHGGMAGTVKWHHWVWRVLVIGNKGWYKTSIYFSVKGEKNDYSHEEEKRSIKGKNKAKFMILWSSNKRKTIVKKN